MVPATESPDSKPSLTAEDWARAALDALAAGGLEALAVEPIARQLGVTKGSFYWHFENRSALLRAALELWEKIETVDVLERIGDEADPYERIVKLFQHANAGVRAGRLYLAIAAAEDHPMIAEFVQRVSQLRMNHLFESYLALGFPERQARHWARFAYATFMGNLQIRRDTPELMPRDAEFSEYLKLMIKTLIPRHPVEEKSASQAVNPDHPHVVPMSRPRGS